MKSLNKLLLVLLSLLIFYQILHLGSLRERIHDWRFKCKICLPQKEKTDGHCAKRRSELISREREFWNLTIPLNPNSPNPDDELLMPVLDQSNFNVIKNILFDEKEFYWARVYYTAQFALAVSKAVLEGLVTLSKYTERVSSWVFGKYIPFNDRGYYNFHYMSLKRVLSLMSHEYYGSPVDIPGFTDIVLNESWQQDKYFTQRRLAGICPFLLRKVTFDAECSHAGGGMSYDEVKKYLNPKFHWEEEISRIVNENLTLAKATEESRLFVLYHEDYDNIPRLVINNPFDDQKELEKMTPVSLFILNGQNDLQIVAIQINDTPNSTVFSSNHQSNPELKKQWLVAKGLVEIVDMIVCQLQYHLTDTHLTQMMFCNVFKRHFSSRHPLYTIIQVHCQGTTPATMLGLPVLIEENQFTDNLFYFGGKGARKLVNKHYIRQHYDDTDFRLILKERGLADISQFDYYPYRDDGKEIWNEIERFASEVVRIYYKNDEDIQEDWELQGFVNEISLDGSATNGAKYKGFPNKFTTREDLTKFVTRFIWINVQHAANNYPLIPYGAYVPIAPTKLYESPSGTNYFQSLPNSSVTLMQSYLEFAFAGIRANRLFDYSTQMADERASTLVQDTYERLSKNVQEVLEKRNRQRFERGDLTYQYLEPKWLANSIHA